VVVNSRHCEMLQVGPDWQQVLDKISRGHCLPLLLVYADHDAARFTKSREPPTRVSVKDSKPASTCHGQSEVYANGKGIVNLLYVEKISYYLHHLVLTAVLRFALS